MYHSHSHCGRVNRRAFLSDVGMGLTGLALGSMLARDGLAKDESHAESTPLTGNPSFLPRAKKRHLVLHARGDQSSGKL